MSLTQTIDRNPLSPIERLRKWVDETTKVQRFLRNEYNKGSWHIVCAKEHVGEGIGYREFVGHGSTEEEAASKAIAELEKNGYEVP